MRRLMFSGLVAALTLGAAQIAVAAAPGTVDGVKGAPLEETVAPTRGVQITSDDGKSAIAISFDWQFTPSYPNATKGVVTTLALGISAPFDDGDVSTKNLDALAGATTTTFKYSRVSFSRVASPDPDAMQAVCDETLKLARRAGNDLDPPVYCQLDWVQKNAPAPDKERLVRAYERLLVGNSPMADRWDVSARVGSDSFEYIEPATLAKRSVDKTAWSAKVAYSFLPLDRRLLLTLEAEHQDAYEAQKESTVCPPGGLPCLTGAVGAPARVKKDIVALGVRRQFDIFAVSATLKYDTSNDVYGIEAPIYFSRDKDGAFNGGIKLNWRSDEGGVTAAVFVGTTFSLGF